MFERVVINQVTEADGPLQFGFVSELTPAQSAVGVQLPVTGTVSGAVAVPGVGTLPGGETFTTTAAPAIPEPQTTLLLVGSACVLVFRRNR